jgi:muramoyltetrapeptide carboxypeptidase LdcA involved in peptidoglycan recycling
LIATEGYIIELSTMIKPQILRPGDKVAAISLSWGGPGTFPLRYEAGKRQFEEAFGVNVVETRHALRDPKWISLKPKARADDLMEAFSDPSIKAIISTIGGDDSVRILPHLDLGVICSNPKIFMGYSDTTVTHLACFKAGLTSFYGPAFMSGFAENGGMFPYMVESVRKTLFAADPIGTVLPNMNGWTVEHLEWSKPENQNIRRKLTPPTGWNFLQGLGAHNGHLLGGCTDALEFLKGTDFSPTLEQWRGAILFIENSEEAPSPAVFRRWLRNYGSQGILQVLNGILFGRPGGSIAPERFADYDKVLKQVVSDELGLTDLPIITGMDFGHTDPMFVIPYGVTAEIDCTRKTFSILESGVLPRGQ